jgi:transcriptional regulator with XRE-family HTH domain
MIGKNPFLTSPPHEVEQALKALGQNLRTARLRRNWSLEEVAAKIGIDRHAVANAERGKATTSIAIYAGLLWTLGMTGQLAQVADPMTDEEGLLLAKGRERTNAYAGRRALDNDF